MKKNATEVAGVKRRKRFIFVSCALLSLGASIVGASTSKEQTIFETDSSQPITRPVSLPEGVLQILSKDNDVLACMKDNPIPRSGSLASWFITSEIPLNGSDGDDLIVLPVAQGDPYMCFHSVEGIGWFWVFRSIRGRYDLVLKTAGLGLQVLDTRHNGYRDIRSSGQVGKWSTTAIFRFENGHYREYRKTTKGIR